MKGYQRIISQLIFSRATFWHIDEDCFNIDEIMDQSAIFLERAAEKAEQGAITPTDYVFVKDALKHM